ncbi:hypothetical protein ACFL6G_07545 [candidate division KSB1 bacterium]
MAEHRTFNFKTIEELQKKAEALGVELPVQDSIDPLFRSIRICGRTAPNRISVQPMEGFDGEQDGSPSELAFRRYRRFAEGGSGLIWFEATSIVPEGRSNPRQLMINGKNLDGFKRLVDTTRQSALNKYGKSHDPYLVLQLTHSGRFSKPEGRLQPLVASPNPYLDREPDSVSIITDDELLKLKDVFVDACRLSLESGFDAVDIKVCHGYLLHDLLTSYKRENSRYGGEEFEKRTRYIREIAEEVSSLYPGLTIAVRLNLYDGIPYPHGFGVLKDGSTNVDLSEPISVIKMLINKGCRLFNGTMGVGFHNPHIGRPYNRPATGSKKPPEHPLEGVSRFIKIIGTVQKLFPETPFVGTGYSWLRHYFPYVGAAVLDKKEAAFIGIGRGAFAYPDTAKDLMEKGKMDPKKVCVTCSSCTELMRGNHITGCIIRDKKLYAGEFKEMMGTSSR